MNEEDIKFLRIDINGIGQLCCFLSVLEGFRDIGLFAINDYDSLGDDFFEKTWYNKETFPSNSDIINDIKQLLEKDFPDYKTAPSWSNTLFFIYRKNKEEDIKNFRENFIDRQELFTPEFERQLWLLLWYPKCCVEKHCSIPSNQRKPTKKELESKRLIPFRKCSKNCSKEWVKEFKRIVDKYQLEDFVKKEKFVFDH